MKKLISIPYHDKIPHNMSSSIETRNRGKVSDFGFDAADTTRIMLGKLPGMPTGQFCNYATEALVVALPLASAKQRGEIRKMIISALESNRGKPVRSTKNPLNLPRLQPIDVLSTEQVSDELQVEEFVAPQSFIEEVAAQGEENPRRLGQLIEEMYLGMNLAKGNTIDYPENPFEVKPTAVVMGRMYEVDFDEFALFATHYIMGGLFGWDSRGIPDYAHESLQTLKQALSIED